MHSVLLRLSLWATLASTFAAALGWPQPAQPATSPSPSSSSPSPTPQVLQTCNFNLAKPHYLRPSNATTVSFTADPPPPPSELNLLPSLIAITPTSSALYTFEIPNSTTYATCGLTFVLPHRAGERCVNEWCDESLDQAFREGFVFEVQGWGDGHGHEPGREHDNDDNDYSDLEGVRDGDINLKIYGQGPEKHDTPRTIEDIASAFQHLSWNPLDQPKGIVPRTDRVFSMGACTPGKQSVIRIMSKGGQSLGYFEHGSGREMVNPFVGAQVGLYVVPCGVIAEGEVDSPWGM